VEEEEETDSVERRWEQLEQTLKVTSEKIIRKINYKNKQRMVQ
jgi:hypothetical protein